MREIKVIEKRMSHDPYDRYHKRFIVVDKNTGEVLDDAQGYGYKSAQNAYKAYGYKNRVKSKDKEKAQKTRRIVKWMEEHPQFVDAMDTFAFEIVKGSWGEDERFEMEYEGVACFHLPSPLISREEVLHPFKNELCFFLFFQID